MNLPPQKEGFSRWTQVAILLIAIVVTIFRNPAELTFPQFYAEDGTNWYAEAYNVGGATALANPNGGYLNTLPRLFAWFSLFLPFHYAPLVMNIAGVVLQALPAAFLCSRRCQIWGSLQVRMLLALIYLVLPNTHEVNIVLTNAQFHLAFLTFLVLLAEVPMSWISRCFYLVVLSISALSGPFCIFLVPVALIVYRLRPAQWRLLTLTLLGGLTCIQVCELLFGGYSVRAPGNLGATLSLFLRMLAGHVFIGTLVGQNGFALRASIFAILSTVFIGGAIVAYVVARAHNGLKLLIAFSALLFVASLMRPLIAGPQPQWQLLASDRGARYWFFPTLAFSWALVWCACQQRSKLFRSIGIMALGVMLRGVYRDYRYPAYPDLHFDSYVDLFKRAKPGDVVEIPIYPDKTVRLIKKP